PQNRVYDIRLTLASQGLPKGGQIGFEIFDRRVFGITDFVQKLNYQRALQGELARTISSLNEVKWARVHIVMPEETLFTTEKKHPSASVLLKLNPGQHLSHEQIKAITYLVAASIPQLQPEEVVIVDNRGNMLAGGRKDAYAGEWLTETLRIQHRLESQLEQKIKDLLERVVGAGKVVAKVSVEMDFSKLEKTKESYDPETKVPRSEQIIEEVSSGSETIPAGIPGVVSNLPQTQASSTTKNTPFQRRKTNKIVNYELTKTIQHISEPMGKIRKISAAVLVDGIYKEIQGEMKYFPRNEEEMQKFKAIVEKAIGFSKERGDQVEVVNVPFNQTFFKEQARIEKSIEKAAKRQWLYHLAISITKTFLLVVFLFAVLRLAKNLLKLLTPEIPPPQELPKPVKELEATVGMLPVEKDLEEMKEELKQIAQKEPSRLAQVAQAWLKEE
ncbi:MAG TPA: flagellar M-ring protein FliF, partial [bacterium]|nr:flagellar M-ring protein FliF [bacterium]